MFDIQKNLKDIRKKHDFTQEDIATACGIGQSHYSQIETGNRNLTESNLQKIVEGLRSLGVSDTDLFKGVLKGESEEDMKFNNQEVMNHILKRLKILDEDQPQRLDAVKDAVDKILFNEPATVNPKKAAKK